MNLKDVKILIVDDEKDIQELLEYHLKKEGYKTKKASNGLTAIEKAKKFVPNIIIMDIMMPELNGIEACKEIRKIEELNETIIVFLSARGEDFTEIMALDSGGDDFLNKPIKPSVFKSKISAWVRRINFSDQSSNQVVLGNLILDPDEFCVIVEGEKIQLAKKEFELLSLLTSKPGKVFKRHKIMNKVWGTEVLVGDRTIDVHIRKLREKIGSEYINTIKGIGYKFAIND